MRRIFNYLNDLTLRAYVALQVWASTEPVRLRAMIVSVLTAAALYVPALDGEGVVERIATVAVVVLPILVGESTRKKVTPME